MDDDVRGTICFVSCLNVLRWATWWCAGSSFYTVSHVDRLRVGAAQRRPINDVDLRGYLIIGRVGDMLRRTD